MDFYRPLDCVAATCVAPESLVNRHLLTGVSASLLVENRVPKANGVCGCGKRFATMPFDRLMSMHNEHVAAADAERQRLAACDDRTRELAECALFRRPLDDLCDGDAESVALITGKTLRRPTAARARRALRRWAKTI